MRCSVVLPIIFCWSNLFAAADPSWIASYGGQLQKDGNGRIVAVNLRGSWVTDSDLLELSRLRDIQRLDLSATRISDLGLLHLKALTSLVELDLSFAEQITDSGVAAAKSWRQLRRLNLRGTHITDQSLAIVTHLPLLEALDFSLTDVPDHGLDQLANAPNLKELALGGSRLSDSGLQMLRQLPGLTSLDLSGIRYGGGERTGVDLTESGPQALATLRNLKELKLGSARISIKGLGTLKSLTVERLGLQNCSQLGDDALPILVSWKSLKWVDLNGTRLTEKTVAALRKERPDLEVLWE